uniref:Trithorax group protein osa n=1 Tax=Syphacia muris TaxID=451379 RepID=A0A0N5AKA7_9BILA
MEQSGPCTSEAGLHYKPTRSSDNMVIYESRNLRTSIASNTIGSSYVSSSNAAEPQSPLGQLDPHRLREMVVGKQNPGSHDVGSSYKQQQQYWDHNSGCPTSSPSNMRLAPSNSNLQMAHMMHSSGISQGRSPLSSPVTVHGPSPYTTRPPSNASSSPYLQSPQASVHYSSTMQQMPQSPAPNMMQSNQVPPASPSNVYGTRVGNMGPPQQQYSYNPQVQQQWNPPPPSQSHYVGQPQMLNTSGQRVMIQRVPYPQADKLAVALTADIVGSSN